MNPDIFEALMLVCFGCAWPFSIYKTWKTKSSKGKSFIFLSVILAGYIFGTLFEIFGDLNDVIYLYILNACMVAFDTLLTYKYRNSWSPVSFFSKRCHFVRLICLRFKLITTSPYIENGSVYGSQTLVLANIPNCYLFTRTWSSFLRLWLRTSFIMYSCQVLSPLAIDRCSKSSSSRLMLMYFMISPALMKGHQAV